MRIAYVINSVEGGGAALPVPAVTRVMREQGATVAVLALARRDGRAIAPMRGAGLEVRIWDGDEKNHFGAYAWLLRNLSEWRPDAIWTSLTRATLLGQLAGRRLGAPVASWQHAAYLKPANRILLRAQRKLSALWVADSESVAALTLQRLGVPPERLTVWPLFAADPKARPAPPWRPGEPVRLGSLGRLHRVKGYDVLIAALARAQAMAKLPALEVRIAGEGAQRAALSAAIAEAGLTNVELPGYVDEPQAFLSGLHLYLQPSRSEGLCVAAHEAMQAGLPCLVSSVGELPYSVRDGVTGAVVAPGDPEALAEALVRLLSRPEDLAPMGARARAVMLDRFGPETFASAGREALRQLELKVAGDRDGGRDRSPVPRASGLSA